MISPLDYDNIYTGLVCYQLVSISSCWWWTEVRECTAVYWAIEPREYNFEIKSIIVVKITGQCRREILELATKNSNLKTWIEFKEIVSFGIQCTSTKHCKKLWWKNYNAHLKREKNLRAKLRNHYEVLSQATINKAKKKHVLFEKNG